MIADRYFAIHPDHIDRFHAALIPDHDVLPYDVIINSAQLATLQDGRVLVHMRLSQHHIDAIRELAGVDDPLSAEAIATLDLAGSYVGETRKEVLAAFPELDGYNEYTDPETGETRQVPKLPKHKWM